jgi:hypothetical protein
MDDRNIITTRKSPRIPIKVTQANIDRSTVADSSHCMIADAVKETVPRAAYVSVDLATIRFTDLEAGIRYVYLTPRQAQLALLEFDNGEKPEPFSFRLEGAHMLATGNARKAKATLKPQAESSTQGTPPERRNGKTPPIGPLQGGANLARPRKGTAAKGGVKTGRRRQFGLRAIIK